jgi:hypothetical protein
MERRLPPRKPASIEEIKEAAKNGNAFFVNRAAENGDLAILPEHEQRMILAQANDEAARHAQDQVIPLKDNSLTNNQIFIDKHANFAIDVFLKEVKDQ